MKVFIRSYDFTDGVYNCVTTKGKQVFVDPFINSNKVHDKNPGLIVGQRFKLKNKAEWVEYDSGLYVFPKDTEWYPLQDKTPIVDCEKFFD